MFARAAFLKERLVDDLFKAFACEDLSMEIKLVLPDHGLSERLERRASGGKISRVYVDNDRISL